ncbi:hypothetical protein PIB30_103793, partial [Stylosanthes scabra]|nr:hypothetical protein [Stylosanthes scabra]
MRGLGVLGRCFNDFHVYAWCSKPYAWTLSLEGIHLLPRIGLVLYAYSWAPEQAGGVKATPRLPGARLGVDAYWP